MSRSNLPCQNWIILDHLNACGSYSQSNCRPSFPCCGLPDRRSAIACCEGFPASGRALRTQICIIALPAISKPTTRSVFVQEPWRAPPPLLGHCRLARPPCPQGDGDRDFDDLMYKNLRSTCVPSAVDSLLEPMMPRVLLATSICGHNLISQTTSSKRSLASTAASVAGVAPRRKTWDDYVGSKDARK